MHALVIEKTQVLALMDCRAADVRPAIADRCRLAGSISVSDYASRPKPTSVKVQIELP
jgi:hypothetical protein